MKNFKVIENQGMLFGMTIIEFGLSIGIGFMGFFLGNVINTFVTLPRWYPLIPISLTIILVFVFRHYNKKKYPNYLLAMISYVFIQPKRIIIEDRVKRKTIEQRRVLEEK